MPDAKQQRASAQVGKVSRAVVVNSSERAFR
jgi:hypothetical protein